jgi:hypothetical protein
MVVGVRSGSNILGLHAPCCQFMLDTANASLATFYPSDLLNKVSTVRSKVPSFGAPMFKFTL